MSHSFAKPCVAAAHHCRRAVVLIAIAILVVAPMRGQSSVKQSSIETQNHTRESAQGAMQGPGAFEVPLSFEPVNAELKSHSGTPPTGEESVATSRYIAHAPGYAVVLAPSQTSIKLMAGGKIDLRFLGANVGTNVRGAEQLRATHSYFASADGRKAIAGVPMYGRVNYEQLYRGINVSFYGRAGRLEYDLVLRPGADPSAVTIALDGAEHARVDESGDLCLRANGSEVKLLKPIAYQRTSDGADAQPVPVRYSLKAADAHTPALLSFAVDAYDRTRELTIDPVLIAGGSLPGLSFGQAPPYYSYETTVLSAMTLDASGNIYVATQSSYNDSPFGVLKFSPSGQLLLKVSLGSSETHPQPSAIAVNAAGDIYLAGTSTAGLPTTPGAFQPIAPSDESAFLTVIKADGSALLYSTYLGGTGQSGIIGLAVDSAAHAYVAGTAYGTDFPTTAGAYQSGSAVSNGTSEFVAKLDPAQSGAASLIYSTYLAANVGVGGNSSYSGPVAVDKSGSAYVAVTASPGFPVTPGAYAFDGIDNSGGYVAKLSPDGNALLYSAFLGPGLPLAVAIDGSGAAYVSGVVTSAEFPTTAGAYQTKYPGGFAAKLSPDGASLLYSTFLSGPSGVSEDTRPTAIALQSNCVSACVAIVGGTEGGVDLPLINAIQSFRDSFPAAREPSSFQTGFLVGLSADGKSALLSTYLGAATSPTLSVGGIAVDSSNNIYFAANGAGTDAPVTLPVPQNAAAGYILKIGVATRGLALALPANLTLSAPQAVSTTTTTTGAIQLRNMGSQAITLQRPFLSSSKEFTESDSCGSTLPAGGICMLDISFTPSTSGVRRGSLTIESSAPNSPTVVSLSGAGVHEPELTVSTAVLNFGDQLVGSSTSAQIITLKNLGDQPQAIVGITASLPDFKVAGSCPAQLPAHSSCVLNVSFSPTQVGLLTGTVFVQLPGSSTVDGYTYPNGDAVALSGTGVLSAGGTGTLVLSASGLNFGSVVVGTPASAQAIALLNTGSVPVTINSVAATTVQGGQGDFSLLQNQQTYGFQCGFSGVPGSPISFPYEIQPQQSCSFLIGFQASTAGQETGTATVSSSAAGGPLSASLSGVGLHSVQALSVQPGKLVFPPQPVGDPSAIQTFTITNGGEDSVVLARAVTSGDFGIDEVGTGTSCEGATLGPLTSCTLNIVFEPTAVGARTGTLTLTDTLTDKPQVFSLAGTGVQATGKLVLSTSSLSFSMQATGTTSDDQELMVTNPGNSPVTINSVTTSGDFAQDRPFGPACVGQLEPAASCSVYVVFSPTKSTGKESGVLTLHSTAGVSNVTLAGTAVAAKTAIQITASSLSFGSVLVGVTGNTSPSVTAYIENTGNEAVTFLGTPVITAQVAADAADFTVSGCYPYLPTSGGQTNTPLPPGQSCSIVVSFAPSRQGNETATLTFADASGKHSVALSGTGVATAPGTSFSPATLSFDQTVVGTPASSSFGSTIGLVNNTTQPITVASAMVTAGSSDFSVNQQFFGCTGQTIYPGSSCNNYVRFTPTKAGYLTGTLTVVDTNGVKYVAPLAGYGLKEVNQASLLPAALLLPSVSLEEGLSASYLDVGTVQLQNKGNAVITIGTISGTNVSPTGDFTTNYPGADYCSGSTVQPGGYCQVTLAFAPKAAGTRSGTLVFPVTYADGSTASVTATVSGVALANQDAAYLLPQTLDFSNVIVGVQTGYSYPTEVTLTNSGTVALTPGVIGGTNLNVGGSGGSDFTLGYDNCSNDFLTPGATCSLGITFTPQTAGQRSGTVTVPVTYVDGATATFTAALSGNSPVAVPALLVTPTSLRFNVEVGGSTSLGNTGSTVLSAVGNVPVNFSSITASANFTVLPNGCGSFVSASSQCYTTVAFTPLASTPPGPVSGTLTIVDDAPGSPHVVALSGTVVSVAQELALSQTSVTFGNQPLGSVSAPQVIYLTDLGDTGSSAQVNSIQLSGGNAADFVETQDCGGSLGFSLDGRQNCTISIAFAPKAHSLGTRTASVTVAPAQGAPLVIQLIGNGVASSTAAAMR